MKFLSFTMSAAWAKPAQYGDPCHEPCLAGFEEGGCLFEAGDFGSYHFVEADGYASPLGCDPVVPFVDYGSHHVQGRKSFVPAGPINFTPSINRHMRSYPWLLSVLVLVAACSGDKEDETATVDKSGSVETAVSVEHADSTHDVLLTRHKVWVNNKEYATVEHRDTVPALGMMSTEGENSEGETTKLNVKKDYQIFITVK